MRMIFIRENDFGINSEMVKDLLVVWYMEWKRKIQIWKREITCLAAAVVIGFCRGFQGEDVLLTSMKIILKNWEEKRLKQINSNVVVTLKGVFKGETGDKWQIILLVDIKYPGIQIIRWLYLDGGWSSVKRSWDHFDLASFG